LAVEMSQFERVIGAITRLIKAVWKELRYELAARTGEAPQHADASPAV